MDQNIERKFTIRLLQGLLTVSRELIQLDDTLAALALVGRAMTELAQVNSALLLIRGESNESIGFDASGQPYRADNGHAWHLSALKQLDGECSGASMPSARTMQLGVPMRRAMAVLVADWDRDAIPSVWTERRHTLETLLELAVATMGRIAARCSLEDLVSCQYEQISGTAQAHADELTRRDEVESEMRELALTDVLTGLNNRRGFFLRAEQLFKLARRTESPSTMLYADVDSLKQVNDQQGHDVGDRMICDAADVLRACLRETDVLARIGGDEFAAFVLDDGDPHAILSRMNDRLASFNMTSARTYRLSISSGAVCCDPRACVTLVDYLRRADQAMYRHKRRTLH